ncbi:MAG: NnrS family protein [Polyangiaceae bacterium]
MDAVKPRGIDVRGEPFRLFFPIAIALGAGGVAHWVLWGTGVLPQYLGTFHAVTQAQGFLLAFAAGFLMTAVPKRTQTAQASWLEIGALAALIPGVSFAELFNAPLLAQALFAAALVVIIQFAVRRFVGRAAGRRPPASFVMVPVGFLAGLVGACLRMVAMFGVGPSWVGSLGRSLALEGVFSCLVLGVGAFFFALALRGQAAPDLGKNAGDSRRAVLYGAAGLAMMAGLALQDMGSVRTGLLVRAAVAIVVLVGAKAHVPPSKPGWNRRLMWLSAWAFPAGLLLAAAFPDDRVAWMHVAFVGGFGLLAFSVGAHVTLGHAGYEAQRDGRPWQAAVFGGLFVAAMAMRATATHMPQVYLGWLATAAAIWLAGALMWAAFLIPKMWSPPIGNASG